MTQPPLDDGEPDLGADTDAVPTADLPPREPFADSEIDFDAAFAALISQFDRPDSRDALLTPTDGSVSKPDPRGPRPETVEAAERDAGAAIPLERVPDPPTEPWYPAILDEHFEPTDPGPLPRGDLVGRLAWAGLLGGPLALILATIVEGQPSGLMVLAAVGAFLAGFVTLVLRMPVDREDDDDDGAVV